MSRFYKVIHAGAGRFAKDTIVSEEILRKEKWDLDGWLQTNAIVQVSPVLSETEDVVRVASRPAPEEGAPASVSAVASHPPRAIGQISPRAQGTPQPHTATPVQQNSTAPAKSEDKDAR